jgi:nitrogen fixation protein NifU and related proteins
MKSDHLSLLRRGEGGEGVNSKWLDFMENDLQKKITEALRDPRNMGELEDADAVGAVGNSDCGEMLRMWVKFKEENGRKVIDRATFQSFGCETAIAVASLATQMIQGKTAEEALSMSGEELAQELGPLPPMKIHCSQLVEGALRSALKPKAAPEQSGAPHLVSAGTEKQAPTLLDALTRNEKPGGRIVFIDPKKE